MERRIGCALLVLALAACGGAGSGSMPSVATQSGAQTQSGMQIQNRLQTQSGIDASSDARKKKKKKVRVKIRIHVPGRKARNKRVRKRMTVSENTKGIQIVAYKSGDRTTPLGTVTADISAAGAPSNGCTILSNGERTCDVSLLAPPDAPTDTDFVATTYDVVPSGGTFPSGNVLGYGVTSQAIAAGTSPTVNFTLNSVLASVQLAVTPASLHTIIPSTQTLSVYALDADGDVIITNQFIDQNGNDLSIGLSLSNSLGSELSLANNSLSGSSSNGVVLTYQGMYQGSGTTPVTITASASGLPNATTTLTAIDPNFTTISDTNLSTNNPYHGGMTFDALGGVYYTYPSNYGGITYYNAGSGTPYTSTYAAPGGNPIRGGIAAGGTTQYAVGGNQTFYYTQPEMEPTPVANSSPAPVPNGSAMAYDATNQALWSLAGTNLVEYPVNGGIPATTSVGIQASAGLTLDSNDNIWYVDNTTTNNPSGDDEICKYNGSVTCYPLEPGGVPYDVLANGNGIFVTDHGSTPAILQIDQSTGAIKQQITVPNGAVPWYMLADNAQPGIIWFDYLINGDQIGLGRMDTNNNPITFSMATDYNGPGGSQPGAIGAASNGLVYMVFEGTNSLIQVQR
jgi:hypothetical protein